MTGNEAAQRRAGGLAACRRRTVITVITVIAEIAVQTVRTAV